MQTMTFKFQKPINTSIQPGDLAFFTTASPVGSTGNTYSVGDLNAARLLGEIVGTIIEDGEVYPRSIMVVFDNILFPTGTRPAVGDYLMFAKDRRANTSSLKGYYAEIDMVNDSPDKIELFSIGLQGPASSN